MTHYLNLFDDFDVSMYNNCSTEVSKIDPGRQTSPGLSFGRPWKQQRVRRWRIGPVAVLALCQMWALETWRGEDMMVTSTNLVVFNKQIVSNSSVNKTTTTLTYIN